MSLSFRHRLSGFAGSVRERSSSLFRIGQFGMWGLRGARRHFYAALVLLIAAVGFAVAPLVAPAMWPYRGVAWVASALAVLALVAGFLTAVFSEMLRRANATHESALDDLRRLVRTKEREATERAEATQHAMKSLLETVQSRATKTASDGAAATAELQKRVSALQEAVSGLNASLTSVPDTFNTLLHDTSTALTSRLDEVSARSVSLDLVSALRPLWIASVSRSPVPQNIPIEHGHALMMAVLAEEERQAPGTLAGRRLIEIGTTRERTPEQGSTAKLAIFTSLVGMRFATVDMDPLNTKRADAIIRYLNPTAKAFSVKGEDFLARQEQLIDYVYLDAFDFDHGKHSDFRRSRYQDILHTDIKDEACWKMHEDCARAIISKMVKGGIVGLDDTWTDPSGAYAGKGKLAMPLFLENGFEVIAKTRTTIALKRLNSEPDFVPAPPPSGK
jgi:hypothetical protein